MTRKLENKPETGGISGRFGLKEKLVLLLVVPSICLLFLATAIILDKSGTLTELKKLQGLAELTRQTSSLVHELQKERGLSAGYLGSEGRLFKSELELQQDETDRFKIALETQLTSHRSVSEGSLLETQIGEVIVELEGINILRADVDSLAISVLEMRRYFDNVISKVLLATGTISYFVNDSTLSRHLSALRGLLAAKEYSGQERAVANQLFSSARFNRDTANEQSFLVKMQKKSIEEFLSAADPAVARFYRGIEKADFNTEVKRIRKLVNNKLKKGEYINQLREEIDYGGLVHGGRNALRSVTKNNFVEISESNRRILALLDKFRALPDVTEEERINSNIISRIFEAYAGKLAVIIDEERGEVRKRAIDNMVKIDNSPAVEALVELSRGKVEVVPRHWWETATNRINFLREVEGRILTSIVERAKQITAGATEDSNVYKMITIFALIITGVMGLVVSRNIVKSERAKLESETMFRNLVEGSIEGIYVHRDFKILFANQAFADMLGYESPSALRELDYLNEVIPPEDRSAARERNTARMRGEKVPSHLEAQHIKKDGTVTWMVRVLSAIQWKGEPAVLVTANDISARKQAEESLRESRDQLRLITDNLPALIIYVDAGERYGFVNKTAENWYGRPSDELIGTPVRDNLGEMEYSKLRPSVEIALSGKEIRFEQQIFYPDEKKRSMDFIYIPDIEQSGKVNGFFGLGVDITEQKALEEQLRQTQKMEALGQLAGGIAHDLNNVLYPIIGFSELLFHEFDKKSQQYNYLEMILESANRAKDLVSQILLFSRRSQGKPQPCNLKPIAREVTRLIRSTIPSTITIEESIGEELSLVFADASQMHQVLMNLIINAVQAMPGKGRLIISLEDVVLNEFECNLGNKLTGPYVKISVTDEGVGMDEDVMKHIFEPFYTTKEVGKGTGLGLSTVFGIVKQHEGELSVQSHPGRGSTFEVLLPAFEGSPN